MYIYAVADIALLAHRLCLGLGRLFDSLCPVDHSVGQSLAFGSLDALERDRPSCFCGWHHVVFSAGITFSTFAWGGSQDGLACPAGPSSRWEALGRRLSHPVFI